MKSSKYDKEGYVIPGSEVSYEMNDEATGKKLIISFEKSLEDGNNGTWFLSEEHEADQHGAQFEYTDYYTAYGSSKCTPLDSWVRLLMFTRLHHLIIPLDCLLIFFATHSKDTAEGGEPPYPTLTPEPKVVPVREKHMLIRKDIARWLIEEKIPNLILGKKLNLTNDSFAISKMVSALEFHTERSNGVSEKMASLFVSIMPPLQTFGLSTSSKHDANAKIEAAQIRLTSENLASKNLASAQKIFMTAESEHQFAVKAVEEAREHLKSLDSITIQSKDEEAFVARRSSVPATTKESNHDEAFVTRRLSEPVPAKNIKKIKGPRKVTIQLPQS